MLKRVIKKLLFYLFIFLFSVPFTLAFDGGLISNIWDKIISIGNLSFLGFSDYSIVVGFVRLLIGLLVFTIFFAVLTSVAQFKNFNRGQAGIIAAILAIITVIFLPAGLLLGIGAGYGTLVALLLIGLPVVGILYAVVIRMPSDNAGWLFIKVVLLTILLWVLMAMKYHVRTLL